MRPAPGWFPRDGFAPIHVFGFDTRSGFCPAHPTPVVQGASMIHKVTVFAGIVLLGLLIFGSPAIQDKMHISRFTVPDGWIGWLFIIVVAGIAITMASGKKVGKGK